MRMVHLADVSTRVEERFGSIGFTIGLLARGAVVHVLQLKAGGSVGLHPSSGEQLLVLVEGDATVVGGDGTTLELQRGDGALWHAGESHRTSTVGGLIAVVVEGELSHALPTFESRRDVAKRAGS
jgi:quercetin dioxygenase-like cupin family protein